VCRGEKLEIGDLDPYRRRDESLLETSGSLWQPQRLEEKMVDNPGKLFLNTLYHLGSHRLS